MIWVSSQFVHFIVQIALQRASICSPIVHLSYLSIIIINANDTMVFSNFFFFLLYLIVIKASRYLKLLDALCSFSLWLPSEKTCKE